MELLVSIVSGAIGGHLVGGGLKRLDLGLLGNTIVGLAGGGISNLLLRLLATELAAASQTAEITGVLAFVASGAVLGGIAVAAAALIRRRIVS